MSRSVTMVRVFIENEAGSYTKNQHDETTLRHTGAVQVSRPYPFPYGFLLDTRNEDGDNLDCYVLTRHLLRRGDIVDCQVIGLMEQTEDDQQDHNVLAQLPDDPGVVNDSVQHLLTDFVSHVFDHIPERRVRAGRFLEVEDARRLIEACRARR